MKGRTLLLAILDGWGHAEPSAANAISVAKTPNMDRWMAEYPFTTLVAHNGLVGLPEGQMGNSEVGHLNIGAGRIVYQDYTRINLSISSGDFFANPVLAAAMDKVKANNSSLHLMGLVSDGGVHSHISHLEALLRMAADKGLKKVFVHCFMDGRDTAPNSGAGFLNRLTKTMRDLDCGRIATIIGRFWAMDRDTRWDRVEKAWQAIVNGRGTRAADPVQAVENAYSRGETDEFIKPVVLQEDDEPIARVMDGDSIIFFNFRADRVRELCRAFSEKGFSGFDTGPRPALAELATFTSYDKNFDLPVAFPPQRMTNILGEIISRQGMRQLRIAETEKYAHVTYFFNGGIEKPCPGEDRMLIDSPREVNTYDQKPEMSAYEVTNTLVSTLEDAASEGNPYDLVVLNFANGDMVGHTGIMAAAVAACEVVDSCLGFIADYLLPRGSAMLITADHGNAEMMQDPETHEAYTAHSLNPVPFILVDNSHKECSLQGGGALKDIAPTILSLLNIPRPAEMEGRSLLICSKSAPHFSE